RQRLEEPHHFVEGADLGAADDLPGLAEDADGDALVVEIETDGDQGCLLKSMDLGNAATGFQVARLAEASLHSLNTEATWGEAYDVPSLCSSCTSSRLSKRTVRTSSRGTG